MNKLLILLLSLSTASCAQMYAAINLSDLFSRGTSIVSQSPAIAQDLLGLYSTLTLEPTLADRLKDANAQAIKLKAFLACKGKKPGSIISSGGQQILTCGDLTVPISVIRLYFAVIKDLLIGNVNRPGILWTAVDLIKLLGNEKIDTQIAGKRVHVDLSSLPTLLNGIDSSLQSFDELLAALPTTLKTKPTV